MSTFESNKFQTAWLGISFVSLEQWAVPEALGMPNTLESAFLGWSLLLLCSGNPNYSFCFCLNFVPPSEYHALPWGEKNLTHMSWISSVGQTQRKDRFLPSQSFLSSEVGDKSEVSQPVLYHFRWWCPDEKSVARRRVWFLLFPMWPRRSRKKGVMNYSDCQIPVCAFPGLLCVWCFLSRMEQREIEMLFYLLLYLCGPMVC